MGKRRRAAKTVVKKVRPTVAKVFKCLFCNHDGAVQCKIDIRTMSGTLECNVCGAKYQTQTHALTEPIDVYTEWLDVTAERQAEETKRLINRGNNRQSAQNAPVAEGDRESDGDE
jgi:transcription elongation factor Elf1